jgi:hypothetical protein
MLITLLALLIAVLRACTLFALPINPTQLQGIIEPNVSSVLRHPIFS